MFFLFFFLVFVNYANAQYLQHDTELFFGKECTVNFFIPDTSEFKEIRHFSESIHYKFIKCKKDNGYLYELKFIPWGEKVIFTFNKMRDTTFQYIDKTYKFLLEIKDFNPEISMPKSFTTNDLCDSVAQVKNNNGVFELKFPTKPDTILTKSDVKIYDYQCTKVGTEWVCTFKIDSQKIYNQLKINNKDICIKLPTIEKLNLSTVYIHNDKVPKFLFREIPNYYKINNPDIFVYKINKKDFNSGKLIENECFELNEKQQLFPFDSYVQFYTPQGISYLVCFDKNLY